MTMVSHWTIYNYWKDKYITDTGKIVLEDDPDWHYRAVISDGVPCCWGCGHPVDSSMKGTEWLDEDVAEGVDLKKIWSAPGVSSKLQRCHIYAKQFGGQQTADNLFLLCGRCHGESPDTTNPSAFFRWVCRKRKERKAGYLREGKVAELLDQEFAQAGTTLIDAVRAAGPSVDISDLSDYLDKNVGLHGGAVATSSLIAAVTDWLLSKSAS